MHARRLYISLAEDKSNKVGFPWNQMYLTGIIYYNAKLEVSSNIAVTGNTIS